MFLLFAIILAVFGNSFSHGNLGDVPFSELTLNMLFGNLFTGACYLGALYLGFKSLEKDRIWPWRWTLPYFGNLLIRVAVSALLLYGAFTLDASGHLNALEWILLLIGVTGLLLLTLFSPGLEFFKEKKEPGRSNENPPN